jgi:hypothetical protein
MGAQDQGLWPALADTMAARGGYSSDISDMTPVDAKARFANTKD